MCHLAPRDNASNLKHFLPPRGFQRDGEIEVGHSCSNYNKADRVSRAKWISLSSHSFLGCSLPPVAQSIWEILAFLLCTKFHRTSWKTVKNAQLNTDAWMPSTRCYFWEHVWHNSSMQCWILMLPSTQIDCIYLFIFLSEKIEIVFLVNHLTEFSSWFIWAPMFIYN